MSLFRRHNNKPFEKQLEEQLGDMEYKPSESLWDRIDSGMSSDGFEPAVRTKLDRFEQIPYPETWNKIESRLPAPKAPLRRFALFGMALVALMFSVATGYLMTRPAEQKTAEVQSMPTTTEQMTSPPVPETENDQEQTDKSPVSEQITPTTQKVDEPNIVQPIATEKKMPQASSRQAQSKMPAEAINPKPTQPASGSTQAKPQSASVNRVQPTALAVAALPPSSIDKPTTPQGDEHKSATEVATTAAAPAIIDTPTTPTAGVPQKADSNMAIQGREITAGVLAQKDSAAPAEAVNDQSGGEDELTRFSISVFGGASLSGTTYSSPKNSTLNFDENISLRKEIERPTVDWSGGFMLDYRLNDRWMVSSGIMMVNFNQQFNYDVDSAVSPANPADIGAPITNPGDSFLVGNTYSNRIRYTWTEIPLLVNYTLHRGARWDIDLQGGVGYAFISTIDGGMVSYDNKGVLVLKDKESFPQISNTVYVTFQPQISKRFGQGVSLGLVPSFKYSVTSIIGNESWIQQHPYFIGISACLRKRF